MKLYAHPLAHIRGKPQGRPPLEPPLRKLLTLTVCRHLLLSILALFTPHPSTRVPSLTPCVPREATAPARPQEAYVSRSIGLVTVPRAHSLLSNPIRVPDAPAALWPEHFAFSSGTSPSPSSSHLFCPPIPVLTVLTLVLLDILCTSSQGSGTSLTSSSSQSGQTEMQLEPLRLPTLLSSV